MPIMAKRHKNKVGYLIFLELKKKSSLKIPILHHAASFNTEAKGGRMVKEWDFEAGNFLNGLKKSNNQLCFYVLWSLLAFSVWFMVSPYTILATNMSFLSRKFEKNLIPIVLCKVLMSAFTNCWHEQCSIKVSWHIRTGTRLKFSLSSTTMLKVVK